MTIPDLELEEMEAWRVYQQHAKETERLLEAWREAQRNLVKARWSVYQPEPCKLKSH